LLRNDLLQYAEPKRILRLLWTHPESAGAVVIDIYDSNALPTLAIAATLVDDIRLGKATLLKVDPLAITIKEDLISAKRSSVRNRAWNIIKHLVDKEPDCSRRLNIDPPCRLKFDPGTGAAV